MDEITVTVGGRYDGRWVDGGWTVVGRWLDGGWTVGGRSKKSVMEAGLNSNRSKTGR